MLEAFFCCSLTVIYIGKIVNGLERETDVNYFQFVSFYLVSVTIPKGQNHLKVKV